MNMTIQESQLPGQLALAIAMSLTSRQSSFSEVLRAELFLTFQGEI